MGGGWGCTMHIQVAYVKLSLICNGFCYYALMLYNQSVIANFFKCRVFESEEENGLSDSLD